MKIRVSVGGIKIQTDGIDLTKRDIHKLLEAAGSVALAILEQQPDEESEEVERAPIGFSAHMDRADSVNVLDRFMEDEE